jgi:hypothetical protein
MSSVVHSPAAERNQGPILRCCKRCCPQRATRWRLPAARAARSHFGAALPGWTWQPTDCARRSVRVDLRMVRAQRCAATCTPPLRLDVLSPLAQRGRALRSTPFDLIYCANMLHIAPWACCAGTDAGAARHLAADGMLVTYGPYLEQGVPTAPGNLAFDASLRAQNPPVGHARAGRCGPAAAEAAGLPFERAPRHACQQPAAGVAALATRSFPLPLTPSAHRSLRPQPP